MTAIKIEAFQELLMFLHEIIDGNATLLMILRMRIEVAEVVDVKVERILISETTLNMTLASYISGMSIT